jgi:hypothetical protein
MYVTLGELIGHEHYKDKLKILIKFPSRSRPDKLISVYKKYIEFADDPDSIKGLITLDNDDLTVTDELQHSLKAIHANTIIKVGYSGSKIAAVNRDMEHAGQFDIVLLASDDMIPIVKGYDTIIRDNMTSLYPDTDGVLWFNDGYQGQRLNTLCILGKAYYDRFNYIYHPSYKSEWCDNEFTEVANQLGKQTYFERIIIRHEHPTTMPHLTENDELYIKNMQMANGDYDNYHQRKLKNFN